MVTVSSGANEPSLNLDGRTVGYVRDRFGAALTIPAGAIAQVNGEEVDDSYELGAGDRLVFTKETAQKG
jgi:hypothetical protein